MFKMRKNFSIKWKASKQARKQRKYRAEAPLHIKRKMISVHLAKDLRKKYGRRAVPARKNDTVKIVRGFFKGKQGKIAEVNIQNEKIYVEGIQRGRKDGTKTGVAFVPSNLMIINLVVDDKKRVAALEKKGVK